MRRATSASLGDGLSGDCGMGDDAPSLESFRVGLLPSPRLLRRAVFPARARDSLSAYDCLRSGETSPASPVALPGLAGSSSLAMLRSENDSAASCAIGCILLVNLAPHSLQLKREAATR